MKTPVFYPILAFLAGIAVFGFLKSLELTKKNADLTREATALKQELNQVRQGWETTRRHLSESYIKAAELETEVTALNTRLARREKEIREYIDSIALLSERLRATAEANASMAAAQTKASERLLRLELENNEMRRRFASVEGLKKAIRELKAKGKPRRPPKSVARKVPPSAATPGLNGVAGVPASAATPKKRVDRKPPSSVSRPGNRGFVVKDGRSTFAGVVDIQVLPMERGAAL